MTQQPYSNYFHQGIAYFPADRLREGLIHGFTIQEHMALRHPNPGLIVNWQQALVSARSAIDHFKIRGNPFSYVERLSGGNQQRTQLALLPQSLQILLMEHPTRGLDVESALWVWQQLIDRCRMGTVILFASSDLDEIMQYSDRVMVFSGGRASEPIEVADLTVDQLGRLIGGQFSS